MIKPPDNNATNNPKLFPKSAIFIELIAVIILTINVTIIAALAWFCTFNNIAIIGIIATNGFKK